MPYYLNPHNHFKIWLSDNPELFLTVENQWRLVKMRAENKDDTIHLLYAKRLLTHNAIEELKAFCTKHRVMPHAIEDEVIPYCDDNIDSARLIRLYDKEINALHHGGCLASASDILRLLKPVYSLGVYSDFDVVIRTKNLPAVIEVAAPIILPLSSKLLTIEGIDKTLENIIINNDTLAIIGEDDITRQKVAEMQQYIFKAYGNPRIYLAYQELAQAEVTHFVKQEKGSNFDLILSARGMVYNAQLAAGLNNHLYDPISLRAKILQIQKDGLAAFIKLQFQIIYPGREFTAEDTDDSLILEYQDCIRKKFDGYRASKEIISSSANLQLRHLYINSVLPTTGPTAILLSLFKSVFLTSDKITTCIKPYSLLNYGLEKAFISRNGVSQFHADPSQHKAMIDNAVLGDACDLSWVSDGRAQVVAREKKMQTAAFTLQRFFKRALLQDNIPQAEKSIDLNLS